MKKTILMLIASLTVGMAAQAHAQASGLTRADVKQQLVQAEAQGLLPSNGPDYPPSARTIARNKAAFAEQHENEAATSYGGAADTHTAP
jgi:hypothetical protein